MTIGIIGRIAEDVNLLDGQTIKTRVLKKELEKAFPESKIICLETFQIKKRLFKIIFLTKRLLKECDCIFVLLSHNGRNVFFPLLYYLNKKYKKPIYHDAIGGRLAQEVQNKKNWRKYVNAFAVNWVELPSLQAKLCELGVSNAVVLPNFKRLKICIPNEIDVEDMQIFKFCTFSRVTETKGITTAANAIRYVNNRAGKKVAELYVYGDVDPLYRDQFKCILDKQSNEVFYGGKIAFDKSVDVIKEYFMLLFPSTHPGEGFPGTFIDAFSAGVPIIASDWNYNTELIQEGVTGMCYPYDDISYFNNLVWTAISNPEKIIRMKLNCLKEAEKYKAENVMKVIFQQMRKDGCLDK